MINLAGFRYRNAFADRGGPVERMDTTDFMVEGRRTFQANAYLRADLFPLRHKPSVYGEASGTGTHDSPMVARFMAISESMERWAYHAKARSSDRAVYAFDVDPMSNGMAAFPGLWPSQARRKAYLEAVERFCIIAWWEGRLPAQVRATPWKGITAAVIWEAPQEVVVILHKQTPGGAHAFGHAAGANFADACQGAIGELARHEYVIQMYRLAKSCTVIEAPTELLERRSVYFSTAEGYEEYVRRLQSRPAGPAPVRRLAFDGRIRGPWEKYAHVWRVVFHPVTDRFLDPTERYFLW